MEVLGGEAENFAGFTGDTGAVGVGVVEGSKGGGDAGGEVMGKGGGDCVEGVGCC